MLVRRGKYWYGSVRVDGVSSRLKTTGCTDQQAALAVLKEWERCAADPAYAASKSATVEQACKAVLDHYAELVNVRKKAKATEGYYTTKLGTISRILGPHRPLSTIGAKVIDEFVSARRKEGAAEHSISKELGALKLILRHALRAGEWSGSIDAIFPRFSPDYAPRDRTLDEDEVFTFLAMLPSDDTAAQVAFSIATSAEAKCFSNAQRSDVSEDGRYVLLRGTKRATRWRTVPIVTTWQRVLLAFALKHAKGDGILLFKSPQGPRNALRKLCLALDLPHVSPNDLRRTFAVHMREAGFPLELIAPLMGHADTRMLERVYGRLSPEQLRERLVMALNAVAPVQSGVLQLDSKRLNAAHRHAASSSEKAPRAGFEPATHGLTVRALDHAEHLVTVRDGWQFMPGAFFIDTPTERTV